MPLPAIAPNSAAEITLEVSSATCAKSAAIKFLADYLADFKIASESTRPSPDAVRSVIE